jgi:hypothetical protein
MPLSLFLGSAFLRRSALGNNDPEEVARRVFDVVRQAHWPTIIDGASPDILGRARAIMQLAQSVRRDEEWVAELCKWFDVPTLSHWRALSDRDFVLAYLRGFQRTHRDLLNGFSKTSLLTVGHLRESGSRAHVVYRLAGANLLPTLRPNVVTFLHSKVGWAVDWVETMPLLITMIAKERRLPRTRVRVLGEIREADLIHFVCRLDCYLREATVSPVFCCTWPYDSRDAQEMRRDDYRPLMEMLRRQVHEISTTSIRIVT